MTATVGSENPGQTRQSQRRRSNVIDRRTQWRWAASLGMAVFVISTIMSSILYVILHQQARSRVIDPAGAPTSVIGVMILTGLAFGLVAAAGTALWSVFITHRICGPLSFMRGLLEQLTAGNLAITTRPLRRKDEFKDFYATLSGTIDALAQRQARQWKMLTEVVSTAKSIGHGDPEQDRKVKAILRDLETLQREAAMALGKPEGDGTPDAEATVRRTLEPALTASLR